MAKYWSQRTLSRLDNIPLLSDCTISSTSPDDFDEPPSFDGDFVGRTWGGEGWRRKIDSMKLAHVNRHGNGKISMVFMDGSARKVGFKELWTLKWGPKFNTANEWTLAGGVQPEDWPEWMQGFREY